MITSLIILILCSVTTPQETDSPSNQTYQPTTDMTNPGDASELETTTPPLDVTNIETTTSQSAWLTQKSTVLTTSESMTPTLFSTETEFPAEVNYTTYSSALEGRDEQDLAGNPGLVAVLCIFSFVVAVVFVVVIVKAVRSRRPKFERLDDVPMGKINEDAPFARYPPK